MAGEAFRGNTRSHVFHQSSCRYYACTNCTAKFDTAREAIEAGYRPCGVCNPAEEREVRSDAAFVGNTNTHRFHRNTCRYAGCANCTAKFQTREEAIAAGFRPGGCCDP
jgi:methylphosphotriester-DNA--protein-cysteine methyltransferase